jgi:hypothetical protein
MLWAYADGFPGAVNLIDFGLCKRYKTVDGHHIDCRHDKSLVGTSQYGASNPFPVSGKYVPLELRKAVYHTRFSRASTTTRAPGDRMTVNQPLIFPDPQWLRWQYNSVPTVTGRPRNRHPIMGNANTRTARLELAVPLASAAHRVDLSLATF